MNTFNKKSLYAALAGLSALGATGVAQAVSVNPDGLGQALVYPYYTVRESQTGMAFNSLLTVINSTASAKAVKVRFLEGKNSREVLDFNLYLSKKDVWVAAVIPTATGAAIFTPDLSCTTPKVGATPATATPFVNYAYTGSAADNADTSLDRTREGYVEIIEMGNIITDPDPDSVYTSVTHVSGVPACTGLSDAATSAATVAGNGGLFGGMHVINVPFGMDLSYDAVALDNFSAVPLWNPPGSVLPNLANVNPKTSVVTTGTQTFITDWSAIPPNNPADPVSAVLMHNNVYNEFVVEAATASGTDWVLTMPTKGFYVPVGPGNESGSPVHAQLQRQQRLVRRHQRDAVRPRRADAPDVDVVLAAAADIDRLDLLGSEHHFGQRQERPGFEEQPEPRHVVPCRLACDVVHAERDGYRQAHARGRRLDGLHGQRFDACRFGVRGRPGEHDVRRSADHRLRDGNVPQRLRGHAAVELLGSVRAQVHARHPLTSAKWYMKGGTNVPPFFRSALDAAQAHDTMSATTLARHVVAHDNGMRADVACFLRIAVQVIERRCNRGSVCRSLKHVRLRERFFIEIAHDNGVESLNFCCG